MYDVNYWNDIHKYSWNKGIQRNIQTAIFCAQMLSNLDQRHFEKMWGAQIVDVGCGQGEAIEILRVFSHMVTGIDFSEVAASKNPYIECRDYRSMEETDVIYCSQLLCFEEKPAFSLGLLEKMARKMLILMVPYDQVMTGRLGEPIKGHSPGDHIQTFTKSWFPKYLGKFERTKCKALPITNRDICPISQLLVVYEIVDEKTKADFAYDYKEYDDRIEYLLSR